VLTITELETLKRSFAGGPLSRDWRKACCGALTLGGTPTINATKWTQSKCTLNLSANAPGYYSYPVSGDSRDFALTRR